MKKLIAVILVFIIAALLAPAVSADVEVPPFENWFVVCGVEGYEYQITDNSGDTAVRVDKHVDPGIRFQVKETEDSGSGQFYLVPQNDTGATLTISEANLNKYFMDADKVVTKETGKKQFKEAHCLVSADGAPLRQGPAETFQEYVVVPQDAGLAYQYTYEYGGHQWAYTKYDGKTGWVRIDQTQKITPTTETTEPPTTVPDPGPVPVDSSSTAPDPSDRTPPVVKPSPEKPSTNPAGSTAAGSTKAAVTKKGAKPAASGNRHENNDAFDDYGDAELVELTASGTERAGFFSKTKNVVIVCCVGAVILTAAAAVVLFIIKKKND